MTENTHVVTIEEVYKNYSPPVSAKRTVSRLLSGIPNKYLAGLRTVVLADAGGLGHNRRRRKTRSRKRKVAVRECGGLYHRKSQNKPAWIEIFVDNLLAEWPTWVLWIPICRDLAFSEVLFHELGHHIHRTQAPEYKEREDVADKWRIKLNGYYIKRRYWYLVPLLYLIARALRPFRSSAKKET